MINNNNYMNSNNCMSNKDHSGELSGPFSGPFGGPFGGPFLNKARLGLVEQEGDQCTMRLDGRQ